MRLLKNWVASMRRWARYQIDPATAHREIMIPLDNALSGIIRSKT